MIESVLVDTLSVRLAFAVNTLHNPARNRFLSDVLDTVTAPIRGMFSPQCEGCGGLDPCMDCALGSGCDLEKCEKLFGECVDAEDNCWEYAGSLCCDCICGDVECICEGGETR